PERELVPAFVGEPGLEKAFGQCPRGGRALPHGPERPSRDGVPDDGGAGNGDQPPESEDVTDVPQARENGLTREEEVDAREAVASQPTDDEIGTFLNVGRSGA